jgi:hypothetical protein
MTGTAALLAAATAAAAMIASPVFAQDTYQPAKSIKASKAHYAKHQARTTSNQRLARSGQVTGDWSRRGRGFWPASAAVGTAGAITAGAINTASNIAAAPFGGGYYNNAYYAGGRDLGRYPYANRYLYGNTFASADMGGWNGGYVPYEYNGIAYPNSSNYDARNAFTCRPGTMTKLGNTSVLCQ